MPRHIFTGPRVFMDDVDISPLVNRVEVTFAVDSVTESHLVLWATPVVDPEGNLHFRTGALPTTLDGSRSRAIALRTSDEEPT